MRIFCAAANLLLKDQKAPARQPLHLSRGVVCGTHGVPCGWAEADEEAMELVLPMRAPRRPISGANEPDLVRGCAGVKTLADEAGVGGVAGGAPSGRWGIGLPGWRSREGALSLAAMGEPSLGEPDGEDSNDGRGESKCWVCPAATLACSFAASVVSCRVGWPARPDGDSAAPGCRPRKFTVLLGEAFLEKLTLFGRLAELNRSLLTIFAIGTTGVGRAPPSDWCNAATRASVDGSAKLGQRTHSRI